MERAFRRTQWESDAAGVVHGGVRRETHWEAANTSVSRARVGRCAVGIDDARLAVGIGGAGLSLEASARGS